MITMILLAQAAMVSGDPAGPPSGRVPPPAMRRVVPALAHGPIPSTSKSSWVTPEDYPPTALRTGMSGTTVFALSIDANGAILSCAVTRSSGSTELDQATCHYVTRRAVFSPAVDAGGRAVPSTYVGTMRWVVPGERAEVPERRELAEQPERPERPAPQIVRAGAFAYSYVVGTDGVVSQCSLISGSGAMTQKVALKLPCPTGLQQPFRDAHGLAVRRKVTVRSSVSIDPLP